VFNLFPSWLIFLLTYEHRNQLHSREGKEPVFGNDVYTIRFEERDHKGLFGHKYIFFLRDAVENVPEYLVVWDNFVQSVIMPSYFMSLSTQLKYHYTFHRCGFLGWRENISSIYCTGNHFTTCL
jgi:hypothetical protein